MVKWWGGVTSATEPTVLKGRGSPVQARGGVMELRFVHLKIRAVGDGVVLTAGQDHSSQTRSGCMSRSLNKVSEFLSMLRKQNRLPMSSNASFSYTTDPRIALHPPFVRKESIFETRCTRDSTGLAVCSAVEKVAGLRLSATALFEGRSGGLSRRLALFFLF